MKNVRVTLMRYVALGIVIVPVAMGNVVTDWNAIGSQVLLAAYEPCAASPAEPRVRYLRRDGRGGVATDLMLRRESGSAAADASQ